MGVVRLYIKDHIKKNELEKDVQGGFTEKAKMENNLFVLRYCVEKSLKIRKPLFAVANDFEKVYDRIRREEIINILMNNKTSPKAIELLVNYIRETKQ